jgi:peptidoglycan/xylan/chitin deacetylase (PgdA/CDA1 family)
MNAPFDTVSEVDYSDAVRSIRLDRLVTVEVAYPLLRGFSRLRIGGDNDVGINRSVPILMYHSISDDQEPGISPYYRTITTPLRFAEQMHTLRSLGWRALNLRDGLLALANSTPMPGEKAVVLTFDDGFRDFYTAAMPVLDEFGFSATVYLPSGLIGNGTRRMCLHGRRCLSWSEVRELNALGIEFGSHTVNHPELVNLSWLEIESEIRSSKSEIENRLGRGITSFAYPYAFPRANKAFVMRMRGVLEAAGYQTCVTTEIGLAAPDDDLFYLKRLPVNQGDDPKLLTAKLAGAYNWLAWPQRAAKSAKAIFHR